MAAGECADLRAALAWASAAGFAAVQLSVVDSELKPREMGGSARRDLAATLARLELRCSGIDMFLPAAHLADPVLVTRAVDAVVAALDFAAELGRVPLTVPIEGDVPQEVVAELSAAAERAGSALLVPVVSIDATRGLAPPRYASLDCASVLAAAGVPAELALRLGPGLGGVRVVDLLRSGLRGPILEPRESRLDALALRASLDAVGFSGIPVADARQWSRPGSGLRSTLARWAALGEGRQAFG